MTTLAFTFETDPKMGVPRLLPAAGANGPWSSRDLKQIEEELSSRYTSLVRNGSGTLQVNGRTLTIEKQAGDTTRQPTLEVHVPVEPVKATETWPSVFDRPKPEAAPAPRPAWFGSPKNLTGF